MDSFGVAILIFWTDEDDVTITPKIVTTIGTKSDLQFVTEAKKMLDKKWRIYYSCWY